MKIRILGIILLMTQITFSQTFHTKLQEMEATGQLSSIESLYLRGVRALAPERLPDTFAALDRLPLKSATGLLTEINSRWNEFSPEQQDVFKPLLARPDLPETFISPNGYFKIHYTFDGPNAVSADDFDTSGVPDYIEEVANSLELSYQVMIGDMGFDPPNDDDGEDGDEWDVYIQNIEAYGYTTFSEDGSEPGTYICYMTMDNDYIDTPTKGLDGVRVTAAHEFFHMVQFGYVFRSADVFIMEAGSTWMEDVVFDYVNDYLNYLSDFFDATNRSFDFKNGWREYGLCVWFHFLDERLETRNYAKTLWEHMASAPAMDAIVTMLQAYNTTFEHELNLFNGWNYMTGYRADTDRFYPEGDTYPVIQLWGDFTLDRDTTFTADVVPTGAKYFRFTTEDGSIHTLIASNLNNAETTSLNECTLTLNSGTGHPFLTDIGGNYQARITAEDYYMWQGVAVTEIAGQPALFTPLSGSIVGFSEDEMPSSFPNPFIIGEHQFTSIPFVLDEGSDVRILIATTSGHVVLDTEQTSPAGMNFFVWDGNDDDGNPAPSGIYVYFISQDGDLVRRDKFALVR